MGDHERQMEGLEKTLPTARYFRARAAPHRFHFSQSRTRNEREFGGINARILFRPVCHIGVTREAGKIPIRPTQERASSIQIRLPAW